MTLMSLAEYARRVGKSRAAMTQWKKAGRLVMQGDQVDVEASDAWLKKYRRDGMPEITDDATTVNPACQDPASTDAVIAGFGFELSAWEVVRHCRHEIEACVWAETGEPMFDDDNATVVPSLLPTLARPFHQHDKSGDTKPAPEHGSV